MSGVIFFPLSQENIQNKDKPLLSKKRPAYDQFDYLELELKKQRLIQSIQEVGIFYRETYHCIPRVARDLPPLEMLDFSQLQMVLQDIKAEITFRKTQHLQELEREETTPNVSILKPEEIIWIDAEVRENKSRSRVRGEKAKTGTKTAKKLHEIKSAVLEDLSEEDSQAIAQGQTSYRENIELNQKEEEAWHQKMQALEKIVQERMADPRYQKDPQFDEETTRLATPFLEDYWVQVETGAELQKFIKTSGYHSRETQLVVLRRESRNPEAYGPVRIPKKLSDQFYTLHAEPNGQETWLEEMQENIAKVALQAAQNLTKEVAIPSQSLPKVASSSISKKRVRFEEKVSARVIFPGNVLRDEKISLETMNLEDSMW